MYKIADFEKVSFEQFEDAWLKCFPETQDVKSVYDSIKLPKRATTGSAGYDFYAPADIFPLLQELGQFLYLSSKSSLIKS